MAVIEEKKEKKEIKKVAKKSEAVVAIGNSEIARKFLVEPWITEKTHSGIADNKYTFKVTGDATKKQVKMGIEGVYSVKVEKLNMVNLKPKRRSYGRYGGFKSGIRKATVTLKKGDKIELFKGV